MRPDRTASLALADCDDTDALMAAARQLRDEGFPSLITYSPKAFVPLTQLCRDVCHYCTFAKTPKKLEQPFLSEQQILAIAEQAKQAGCYEILFTLGDKPELRYKAARDALAELGYESTIDYLRAMAERVWQETGLLPHLNPGVLSREELRRLRPVAASMGLMLESSSLRLTEKGQAHYGSPDKDPQLRLASLAHAGAEKVPVTTGILIGIGETRRERIESLLDLRDLHDRYGHIQEIIVQNFRRKPNTVMANAPEPDLAELQWTIAVARILFGANMSLQAPPNLSADSLVEIIDAGINDWGGVSAVTPDHVNPEAPWPEVRRLTAVCAERGKTLVPRLPVYPAYIQERDTWIDPGLHATVLQSADSFGLARASRWSPGMNLPIPAAEQPANQRHADDYGAAAARFSPLRRLLQKAQAGQVLSNAEIVRLFSARGAEYADVCRAADELRQELCGDTVSYVVNRNINYTNICSYNCKFCAFSKGSSSKSLRGPGYDLPLEEIAQRSREAWEHGATEVCLQGGIHPAYTGQTYLDITRAIRAAVPEVHIHAFSALEVSQGAATLGLPVRDFLVQLKEAGLGSLPGTAAEILDDEVRQVLCADKLNTHEWLQVVRSAHDVGLPTTSTIMFGHLDQPQHWAKHLQRLRELQLETGGLTEFVPLPFVHMQAPVYRRGQARRGPTFREAVLMHAVARLVFHKLIPNIQGSWAKLGHGGLRVLLDSGVNDLGGTLMNESISRAAGAEHGQEMTAETLATLIADAGRTPRQRNTLYENVTTSAPVQLAAQSDISHLRPS